MIHLYLISGLGADEEVFDRLRLRDDIVVHHLPWKRALDDESISSYAERMAQSIRILWCTAMHRK